MCFGTTFDLIYAIIVLCKFYHVIRAKFEKPDLFYIRHLLGYVRVVSHKVTTNAENILKRISNVYSWVFRFEILWPIDGFCFLVRH